MVGVIRALSGFATIVGEAIPLGACCCCNCVLLNEVTEMLKTPGDVPVESLRLLSMLFCLGITTATGMGGLTS